MTAQAILLLQANQVLVPLDDQGKCSATKKET
jgi:hypothetical protein